jgi:hypothetical protein
VNGRQLYAIYRDAFLDLPYIEFYDELSIPRRLQWDRLADEIYTKIIGDLRDNSIIWDLMRSLSASTGCGWRRQDPINAKISITIKAELEQEEEADHELPLNHQDSVGDAVPLEGLTPTNPDGEETQMSRKGRQIQASAAKKARGKK